jgi:hypothetical protein
MAFKIKKIKTKGEARQVAIDWQSKFANKSMTYSEVAEASQYFSKLGKKFRLTKEFKENGII